MSVCVHIGCLEEEKKQNKTIKYEQREIAYGLLSLESCLVNSTQINKILIMFIMAL